MKTKKIFSIITTLLLSLQYSVFAQPPGSGWGNPVFADEFNGSSVNTNIWRVRNEANSDFFANMVSVSGGKMIIKNNLTNSSVAQGKRGGWVDSKQFFGNGADFPKYGYFEARIRINRQGINFPWQGGKIWPTWWIWGGNYRNGGPAPSATELDVMEYSRWTNFKANDNATSSHHYFNQRTINGKKKFAITDKNSPRDEFNWHRWGVLWTPNRITFYYDGVPFGSSDQPGDAANDNIPSKLIFSSSPHVQTHKDLAASGAPRVSDILPSLEVDWVRVWQGGNAGGNGGNNGGGNAGGDNGSVVKIPGTLEAENNKALNGGVRIVDVPGGKKGLGYIKNNTWSEHFIEIPSGGGTYTIDLYGSSGGSGGTIDLTINGNKLATLNAPKTNGWNDYKKLSTTNNVRINGGVKTVRLVYKGSGNFLFNVDGLVFKNASGGGGNNSGPLTCANAPTYNSSQTYSPGQRVINPNDRRLYERTATGWDFIEQCGAAKIIDDAANSFKVSVKNNPVTNGTIYLSNSSDSTSYSISSISGQIVQSGSINGNTIDVSGLNSNLYILQITSETNITITKIIIR